MDVCSNAFVAVQRNELEQVVKNQFEKHVENLFSGVVQKVLKQSGLLGLSMKLHTLDQAIKRGHALADSKVVKRQQFAKKGLKSRLDVHAVSGQGVLEIEEEEGDDGDEEDAENDHDSPATP